ncbi:hypothetical protein EDB81DRAFT_890408 [Dactylonectria macrodidyma]|uniref:Uncharacterized protein n=1 Tax=Dactylonectria macrodidyma TaxID=307937 RepID=A0A9P9IM96_9HYPO|nr:hypothetical protein EDB81DRAFT_890408 [Dactylonectria macrodidyma]
MSSLRKKPDDVIDGILKRAELSKLARRLQSLLALARFKTKHGWEDLTLDTIEPNFEEEIRQKRLAEGNTLFDSAFSASNPSYSSYTLLSFPLKPDMFSNVVGSRNQATSHRKRTYFTSFKNNPSSPSKPFRLSRTAHKSVGDHSFWNGSQGRAQPSPVKPCRQQHFTPVDHASAWNELDTLLSSVCVFLVQLFQLPPLPRSPW